MRRREALQWVSRGIGATALIGVPATRLLALGQELHHRIASRPGRQRVLQVLDQHQDRTVGAIAEHIIPETDTPGARAARVNEFIDLMLAEWLDDDERVRFLRGLTDVDTRSLNQFGTVFVQLKEAQQVALLEGLDAEVTALREADAGPEGHFFNGMKWLTLVGYYTSEIGQTQELQATVIPGRYDPCGPVRRDTPGRVVMQRRDFDAIVIGSGMTGGWAAKELTEQGLETLVLEAGPPIHPAVDYTEHTPPWSFRYRGLGDRKRLEQTQPIQRECYACDEGASKFFVNDLEHPYTHDDDKPFLWIRGRQVGGRSIMWARQSYRWSDLDFEANARDGFGVDWPIRYADLEPWYDYVEEFVGISGAAEGLPQLPDSKFLPAMPLNCVEELVGERMARRFGRDRVLTIGRAAVLTIGHRGRAACHYCGPCHRGCITRSYFSALNATLPAAATTGRLMLRPNSVVAGITYDATRDRARGVRVIDAETHEELEFAGRVVFLCASALESTRILLNSKNRRFPTGLGNSSGELGRYLMDHTMRAGASGTVRGFEDRNAFGIRPNGLYIPRFRNVTTAHPDFIRGYGFQGGAGRPGWTRGTQMSGFGADFKHALRTPGPWRIRFGGFGECLPRSDNFVALDPLKVDTWGIPALRIQCTWGENERAMLQDMAVTAAEMLEAGGAIDVETTVEDSPPGLTIHEMGTARMGRDPKTSVLNSFNQMHDVKNVFVTDGAAMASSACQNPSLTYMALTARACNYVVEQLKGGEL